jgi:hypothetical protein
MGAAQGVAAWSLDCNKFNDLRENDPPRLRPRAASDVVLRMPALFSHGLGYCAAATGPVSVPSTSNTKGSSALPLIDALT